MNYEEIEFQVSSADMLVIDMCKSCGCLILDLDIHDKWHEENYGTGTVSSPVEGVTEITNW